MHQGFTRSRGRFIDCGDQTTVHALLVLVIVPGSFSLHRFDLLVHTRPFAVLYSSAVPKCGTDHVGRRNVGIFRRDRGEISVRGVLLVPQRGKYQHHCDDTAGVLNFHEVR